jgi:TetR/AcrR family transcriptional repressor of nem operon
MQTTNAGKRERLVKAAEKLVLRAGFYKTTLADIASEADVPLGNVYYYFKTKEEIGRALIDHRADSYHELMALWNELPDPRKRILAFIQMIADNRDRLTESGCPVGSLCQELQKQGGPLADKAAEMFGEFIGWLEKQFRLLGRGKESPDLALQLLSALQGATLLTHSLKTPDLIMRETKRLKKWIGSL